jgi:hypothetical protein
LESSHQEKDQGGGRGSSRPGEVAIFLYSDEIDAFCIEFSCQETNEQQKCQSQKPIQSNPSIREPRRRLLGFSLTPLIQKPVTFDKIA